MNWINNHLQNNMNFKWSNNGFLVICENVGLCTYSLLFHGYVLTKMNKKWSMVPPWKSITNSQLAIMYMSKVKQVIYYFLSKLANLFCIDQEVNITKCHKVSPWDGCDHSHNVFKGYQVLMKIPNILNMFVRLPFGNCGNYLSIG
jgi:hypothetical protein